MRFGKPCLLDNVTEELDPALEPILLQQLGSYVTTFIQWNVVCVCIVYTIINVLTVKAP